MPPQVPSPEPLLLLPAYAQPEAPPGPPASGYLNDLLANHLALAEHDSRCQTDKQRLLAYLRHLKGIKVIEP